MKKMGIISDMLMKSEITQITNRPQLDTGHLQMKKSETKTLTESNNRDKQNLRTWKIFRYAIALRRHI